MRIDQQGAEPLLLYQPLDRLFHAKVKNGPAHTKESERRLLPARRFWLSKSDGAASSSQRVKGAFFFLGVIS